MIFRTIIFFSIILFSSFYSPSNEERIEAKFEKELELINENPNNVNTDVSRKPKPSISSTSKLSKSKKTE